MRALNRPSLLSSFRSVLDPFFKMTSMCLQVEGAHHNDVEERQEFQWAISKFSEYLMTGEY